MSEEHLPDFGPEGLNVPRAEHRCPLCGGPNGCAAAAAGRFDVACWCTSVHIPVEVIARIPAEQRGRACICLNCAIGTGTALHDSNTA